MREEGGTLIDDFYNANPMSMKASLSVLAKAEGRKVAILGNMGELGEDTPAFHREVGAYAAELPLDVLITVGDAAELIAEEAGKNGTIKTVSFKTMEDLLADDAAPLFAEIKKGDTILLKASHSMEFGQIQDVLLPYLKA